MAKQLLSIAICLTLLVTLAKSANAQTAGASYNFDTGEVIFTLGENISVVGLALLTGATFDLSAAPRIGAASDISPAQFNEDSLAYFDANGLPAGVYSQGNVLPTGLGASDLGFEYTPIGHIPSTPRSPVEIIPEPSTLILSSLATLALIQRRRRS